MASLVIDIEDIRPVSVSFTETSLIVELADRRSIATPLASLACWLDSAALPHDPQVHLRGLILAPYVYS